MEPHIGSVAQLLFEASRTLLALQDLPATLRTIVAKTRELLGTSHAQILLWDETTETLSLGAADGSNVGVRDLLQYGLDRGVSGVVARTREPLIVNDYPRWPHRFADLSDVVAAIGTPLIAQGRFLGVLTSCSIVPGTQFEEDHLHLLAAFAALASVAIENARIHDAAQRELTTRRQAGAALLASEERIRAILDATQDVAFLIHQDGRLLALNHAFRAAVGQPKEALIGRVGYEILDPHIATTRRIQIEDALRSGSPYEFEDRHRGRDFEHRVFPIRDPDGRCTSAAIFTRNVTQQKEAEKAQKKSAANLHSIFEAIHESVFLMRLDGTILAANDTFAERLGKRVAECIGANVYTLLPPEVAATRKPVVAEVIRAGRPVQFEDQRQGRWQHHSVFPVRDPDGSVSRLVVYARDDTARKQAEEALHASEERYRRLFEEATEGILLADAETGFIVDCNAAFEQLSGYARSEIIGRPQKMLHPPENDTSSAVTRQFAMVRELHEGQLLDSSVVTKTGTLKSVEIKAHTLTLGSRRILQGFFRDVTEEAHYQRERETTLHLLRLLNDQNHTHDLIREVTRLLQEWTGCEAVGVRLRDGDDFPYYETRGFPAEFVQAENQLCLRDTIGQPIRDADGNPVLECMCGNILCGRFNPALPFFTPQGSFWSNNTTALLASTSEADRQARTRNRCNGEGYESVALIPLRQAGRILGLLQLNDHAVGHFTPQLLEFLENAADQLAIALAQRQAQAALRESEARFRALALLAPAGIYLTDPDGRCQYVNPRWCEVAGLSPEEALGDGWVQGLHPEDRASVIANWQRMVSSAGHWGLEYRFQTRDGKTTWVYGLATPQRDDSGQITRYIGLNLDITDRKRAEAELRKSERRYREVVENLNEGVWAIDANASTTFVNARMAEMLGYRVDEMAGRHLFSFMDERGVAICKANLERRRQSIAEQHDFEFLRKDGIRVYTQVMTAPIRDDSGAYRGAIAGIMDITQRKQTEEARALMYQAVEQTGECVVITDVEGTIQYVNPAFERITGYTRTEAIGQNPRLLKSGKQDPGHYEALWRTITQGEVWTGLFINCRKDGSLYEEQAVISPIRDAAGAITNFVAVKRDVTREREMETQLQQAQKMEAVGRLAGGIAHDFNNLLFLILGSARVLLEERPDLDPLAQELLADIQAAGNRAAELTDQLLAFSRKQARHSRLLDLNVTVSRVEKMLRRLVGESIRVVMALAPDPAPVHADAGQLEQVLVNLAANARDAMPHGGTLTFATRTRGRGESDSPPRPLEPPNLGAFVELTVTDTGTGMDTETLAHLFEPFFTTKGQGKGTGLGLATVHGIVEQSGGTIWVESAVGQGTTFTISLPRAAAPPSDMAATPAPPPAARGSEIILLVEDQTLVRNLARRMLHRQGYTVLEAASGPEALLLADRHAGRIHLLLTDIVMPEMRGPELAAQLTARHPDLRVLYMSGHPGEFLGSLNGVAMEMPLLHKPFTSAELARHVRQALDH